MEIIILIKFMSQPSKRVVIKVSGEAMSGNKEIGIDLEIVNAIVAKIIVAAKSDHQIGIVVGGGNFFRGREIAKSGDERAAADYIGMLATAMNALVLQIELEKMGVQTRVQTALDMKSVAEPFIRRRAIRHLEKGRVVIFAAGTGLPFNSTDLAAVVRALEINADMVLKATLVDGVYTADPRKDKSALKINKVSFEDVRQKRLKVMDLPAVTLAEENDLPIRVFKLFGKSSLVDVIEGRGDYSEIS
jgi:uridylate kinase